MRGGYRARCDRIDQAGYAPTFEGTAQQEGKARVPRPGSALRTLAPCLSGAYLEGSPSTMFGATLQIDICNIFLYRFAILIWRWFDL